jgi:hypothetical protein
MSTMRYVWAVEKYSRIVFHDTYRTFVYVTWGCMVCQVCFSKGIAFVSLGLSGEHTGGKGE